MLSSVYKCFATALFFTSSLSTSSTSEDYFSKLTAAVTNEDVNTVHQLLLQNSTDWLTEKQGWEIARIAAEKGNLPVIQYIAERKLSILKNRNEKNETIGHIAAEQGHPTITQYFVEKIESHWTTGSDRESLLDLAAKIGDLNCISRRVNSDSDDLERIGRIAAQNGHLDVACYMAIKKNKANCTDFGNIILTALMNSHKRDPKTLGLFEKLTDEWGTVSYCPSIVEMASSANNTELIEYLAKKKCTHFLKCDQNEHTCRPMKIAFERNLVNQNFLECLERGKDMPLGYILESKSTICHLAAEHGRLDVIRFLAERNAFVLESMDHDGKTVANIAVEKGYADILRYAVRQKPLTTVLKTWTKSIDGKYKWYYSNWKHCNSTAFHLAIAKDLMDLDTLKYVIEKEGTDIITRADLVDGETVAHTAARNANMEILQYLVEKNPSVLSMSDTWGETVLHILACKKMLNKKWLKFFVDMGAPLGIKDCYENTVGHMLAKAGHMDLVEYLAEIDPSMLTIGEWSGDTMLHIFVSANAISVKNLKFFVDKGASLLRYNNRKENIPIIAAKNGNIEILRFVLEKETSVFEGNMSVGIKMAEMAASHGHSNVLKLIVDKKPILLADIPGILFQLQNTSLVLDILQYIQTACEAKIPDWERRNFENKVLSEALEYDCPDVLRFMKYDVNIRNDRGEPLIFTAVYRDRRNIFYYLASNSETNLTALDHQGNNILFVTAVIRDLKKMQYILDTLKVPFDIEWRNHDGNSLLHVAVHGALAQEKSAAQSTQDDISLIKYLVEEKHARADTSGHENMTALHCATLRGKCSISNYLLDHGAQPLTARS